jgi:hypothetical protein
VNPERGEAPFPGTDYTVRFTLGSLCELEAQLGESYSVIARLAASGGADPVEPARPRGVTPEGGQAWQPSAPLTSS